MDAGPTGNVGGIIAAAIIDHQIFNGIDTGEAPWQRLDRVWKCGRFVVARNLNDQFQETCGGSILVS